MLKTPPYCSYPFLYITTLRGLPSDERLLPVNIWLPIAPDLSSGFECKESCYTQSDYYQESTRHGNALKEERRKKKIRNKG